MGFLRRLPVLRALGFNQRDQSAARSGRRQHQKGNLAPPPSARADADEDMEASPVGEHQLVKDPEHGMFLFTGSAGYSHASDQQKFFNFYQKKVRELQEKAGDAFHAPISGNLYMYRAISKFGDSSGLFQSKATPLMMVGLSAVVIVQLVGPFCILFYAFYRIDFGYNGSYFGTHYLTSYEIGSMTNGVSYIAQRILGTLFLVLFTLNGTYTLKSDREETTKLVNMCKIFQQAAEASSYKEPLVIWLWAGALINGLCLILCSICMCFLFILAEDGPKDVLFDAFGLTFLYNLDDIGGDLGFLDEKWDEDQLGDIYGMLNDDLDIMEDIEAERESEWTPDNVYVFFEIIATVLIVVLPLTFLFLEMTPKPDGRRLEVDVSTDLQERVAMLEATIAKLQQP